MNPLRRGQIAHALCAAFLALAWVLSANRCGVAMLIGSTPKAPVHACCARLTSGATDRKQDSAPRECCLKLLPVLAKAEAKISGGGFTADLVPPVWPAPFVAQNFAPPGSTDISLDTGPPEARRFAELVLQHSLLSHAPPRLS